MASLWGVQMRYSDLSIGGQRDHLMSVLPWNYYGPPVFQTRREAREFIAEHFGYLKKRPDLASYPHGWLMPRPVKIQIVPRIDE